MIVGVCVCAGAVAVEPENVLVESRRWVWSHSAAKGNSSHRAIGTHLFLYCIADRFELI